MDTRYEHHSGIRKDRLCPFYLNTVRESAGSPCNWHRNIEIVFITGGSGSIRYDSELIPLEMGDIVVIGRDVIHQLHGAPRISYDYLIIDELFAQENGLDTSAYFFTRRFNDKYTRDLFSRVASLYGERQKAPAPTTTAKLRRAVLELLIDLIDNHASSRSRGHLPSTSCDEYIKRVLEHLNSNFTSHITLDSLAALAGVSKYHLTREFKRYTGNTIMTYINILRCKRAEVAISEGMTVTEAAIDAGFESLSYFSRTYKRYMGASPSSRK